jgi:hypothetical protein
MVDMRQTDPPCRRIDPLTEFPRSATHATQALVMPAVSFSITWSTPKVAAF